LGKPIDKETLEAKLAPGSATSHNVKKTKFPRQLSKITKFLGQANFPDWMQPISTPVGVPRSVQQFSASALGDSLAETVLET